MDRLLIKEVGFRNREQKNIGVARAKVCLLEGLFLERVVDNLWMMWLSSSGPLAVF